MLHKDLVHESRREERVEEQELHQTQVQSNSTTTTTPEEPEHVRVSIRTRTKYAVSGSLVSLWILSITIHGGNIGFIFIYSDYFLYLNSNIASFRKNLGIIPVLQYHVFNLNVYKSSFPFCPKQFCLIFQEKCYLTKQRNY